MAPLPVGFVPALICISLSISSGTGHEGLDDIEGSLQDRYIAPWAPAKLHSYQSMHLLRDGQELDFVPYLTLAF